jgi:alpha-tubulin suppressor-like RCC1 family protein
MKSTKQITDLPPEALVEIFSYIRGRKRDIHSLACVNSKWNSIVDSYFIHKQVVVTGRNYCLSITADGECYSWGENQFGQLGYKTTSQCTVKPRHIDSLQGKQIAMVAAGSAHNLALSNDGKCYAWGRNVSGQLGTETNAGFILEPTLIKTLPYCKVAIIACGASHSMAVTTNGKCYSWGFNGYGQLGLGHTKTVTTPQLITSMQKLAITHISAAVGFTLAHTLNDECYSWGQNGYGQLGIGAGQHQTLPVRIGPLCGKKIRQLCGGVAHSIALSSEGTVYSWGRNSYGQLGLGKGVANSSRPREITSLSQLHVSWIASGYDHCLAITHKGCYSWGLNSYGQLGHKNHTNLWEPKSIEQLEGKQITVVAAGHSHSLALSSHGECFAWGLNSEGQLGSAASQVLAPHLLSLSIKHHQPHHRQSHYGMHSHSSHSLTTCA